MEEIRSRCPGMSCDIVLGSRHGRCGWTLGKEMGRSLCELAKASRQRNRIREGCNADDADDLEGKHVHPTDYSHSPDSDASAHGPESPTFSAPHHSVLHNVPLPLSFGMHDSFPFPHDYLFDPLAWAPGLRHPHALLHAKQRQTPTTCLHLPDTHFPLSAGQGRRSTSTSSPHSLLALTP